MFLRLRQLCLVAQHLEPVLDDLCAVFDVPVCHRDPAVGRFGLHNGIVALGTRFVEVVAPLREDTAAGRYLQRRGGSGGYMVILDSDGLDHWRRHLPTVGVRVAAALEHGDYAGLQMHPRDTGGALLEINATRGNSADPWGPYAPAGPKWQESVRTTRVRAITAAVLQSDDPEQLAHRWSEILERPVSRHANEWRLALDSGMLRFVTARDGRGEGLAGIDLDASDAAAIRAAAAARGCPADAEGIDIGGVRFTLGEASS